ncbi:MAG: hypothetical protein KDC56_05560, partial [Flavobacteriaceae bacterium]|nr:hypothetical protein [Flavobacteriaceae bacterium]
MPEPTLRDITIMGAAADPQLGTGTPAVVYDNSKLINTLNNAAQYHAENEWRKYNLFLNNIKDAYKDVNNIAQMEVMTQDREGLKKKMGEILKGISSDPRGFVSGGAKYQEIMGQIASLQSDATESKANSLYDKAHRQYFYQNPELDTEENRTKLESFPKQPLGSRQQYTFRLPGMYDAG